ncbi:hypothetical protein FHR47_002403 [Xanthomonas arboricola]|uniref:hypothetical protein n=1 Tax=Xanthomonas cannabis TaxID=1885674 RepID=UPI00162071B2|nr:hypothetical protein [Xanthomonas cannabis]MBB3802155.1 hypothetical protein [Xanthomonas cannabis]
MAVDKKYEFIFSSGTPGVRSVCTEDPAWERVVAGIDSVFVEGGRASLIIQGSDGPIRAIIMEGAKGVCRLLLKMNSDDPRFEILKWWDESGCDFKIGPIIYLDQKWDPRGWMVDAEVAKKLMKDFFDKGRLDSLLNFKSPWDVDFSFKD